MPKVGADGIERYNADRGMTRSASSWFVSAAIAAGFLINAQQATATALALGSDKQSRVILRDYSRCLAETNPIGARNVLWTEHSADSELGAAIVKLINNGRCSIGWKGEQMHVGGVLLAGGLAEALIIHAAQDGTLARAVGSFGDESGDVARRPAYRIAFCVLRSDPADASKLIAATPLSATEDEAAVALTPLLGACTGGRDVSKMNRESIRALVAVVGYRILHERSAPGALAGSQ